MRIFKMLLMPLLPSVTFAGGWQISEQGQKACSMGGAFAAISNDASSVFYNPGAMSFSEKSSISFGGCFLSQKTNYLSPYSGNVKADNHLREVFHVYADFKINDKLAVGIGINDPFGSSIKWADDWEGRYVTQQYELKTTFIQPAVSYMINEKVGLGAGLVYAHSSSQLRKAIPVGTLPDGQEELKMNDNSIGFNIGLFVKLNNETTVGLNYRSAVKFDFANGDATFADIPPSLAADFPSSPKFNSQLKLPTVISAGIAYKFTKNLSTTLQIDYNRWSTFDSLNFIFPEHADLDTRTGRASNNCITARIGGQYSFTDRLDVRVGGAFDQSPVPDNYLSPEFPDADKILLTIGVGFKFNDKLNGDLTIGTENYFERKGQLIDENFAGSYKSNVLIAGIGLNYNF